MLERLLLNISQALRPQVALSVHYLLFKSDLGFQKISYTWFSSRTFHFYQKLLELNALAI